MILKGRMQIGQTTKSPSITVNLSVKEYFNRKDLDNSSLKKIQNIYEKANNDNLKIISALEEYYVKGRINKSKYKFLMNRKNEITIDLIIFGKILYVSFALKYITGEISCEEYQKLIKDILPEDFILEKEKISNDIIKKINNLEYFKESIKITEKDTCQLCETKETLFNKLKIVENIRLCSKCRKHLINLEKYDGLAGKFLIVNPILISLDDISNNLDIEVYINFKTLIRI